jgi:hypothetical protein
MTLSRIQKIVVSITTLLIWTLACRAANPPEDIAESWTEFVLRPKPVGASIAEQKALFFYEFPELVQTRREILQGVCQFALDQK